MHVFARRLAWLVPAGFICLLVGCGSSSSAYVKTLNASLDHSFSLPVSPGTPFQINVKIGTMVATNNLKYGDATSTYEKVGAGSNREIQISFSSLESNPEPKTINSTLLKNRYYTLISTASSSALGATVLTDDLTPPTSGDFKVRLVHEADEAGPVDIYIVTHGVNIDDPKNPVKPVLSDFDVGAISTYLQVPAGTYDFIVTSPGDPSHIIIYDYFMNALPAGNVYTAVLLDPHMSCYPGSACPQVVTGFSVFLTQDEPVLGVPPTAPTP